jgi:iron complex transport system substrate-binding protein
MMSFERGIKMRKMIVPLLLLIVLSITGCGSSQVTPPPESDPEHQEMRIVSLSPSQTETLYALGLEDQIIGVSDYCDYPEAALEKEKLGSSWTINLERILELEPTVVFVYAGGQPEAVEHMTSIGIEVVDLTPESVEEVFDSILLTGEVTGTESKAEEVVERLRREMEEVLSKVEGRPAVPVFYQVWDEPLQTVGPGSFIHELIELAGGENIAGDTTTAYPMYSVEALVENNPEIYFMPPHVADFEQMSEESAEAFREEVRSRPGFDQVKAVQNNRIELMEPNIMSRPGVRIVEGLRLFAEAMHPEVF